MVTQFIYLLSLTVKILHDLSSDTFSGLSSTSRCLLFSNYPLQAPSPRKRFLIGGHPGTVTPPCSISSFFPSASSTLFTFPFPHFSVPEPFPNAYDAQSELPIYTFVLSTNTVNPLKVKNRPYFLLHSKNLAQCLV